MSWDDLDLCTCGGRNGCMVHPGPSSEELQRRMAAVRGYAQTAVDLGRAFGDPSMERVGSDILRLLDGESHGGA